MNPSLISQAPPPPDLTGLQTPNMPSASPVSAGGSSANYSTAQQLLNNLGNSNAAPTPLVQHHGGGLFGTLAKLLPTAGAVLATALAPETGGASLLADAGISALAAGAGAGAGQVGQNLLEGKSALSNVGQTAGLNAAFGGAGDLAGAGLSKIGGGLINRGASMAEANQAAADAAQAPLSDVAKAEQTQLNYPGIPDKMQTNLKLGTHQNTIESMGYNPTDPYAMNLFSKGGLDINNKLDQALTNASDIKLPELVNQTVDYAKNSGLDNMDLQNTPLGNAFLDSNVPMDANTLTAPQLRNLRQSVNTQLRTLNTRIAYAEKTSPQEAMNLERQAKPLQSFQDYLDTKLNNPNINEQITQIKLTPEEETALQSKYGEQQGQALIKQINGLSNYSEASQAMRPYAQMEDLSSSAINNLENATATPGAVARAQAQAREATGQPSAKVKAITPKDSLVKTGANLGGLYEATVGGHPLAMLPAAAMDIAGSPEAQMGLGKFVKSLANPIKAGKLDIKIPTTLAAIGANIPNMAAPTSTAPAVTAPGEANLANSVLGQTLQQDITAGREANIDPFLAGNYSAQIGQISTLLPLLQRYASAENALNQLTTGYNAAGGGQGGIGGLATGILSLIPGTAQHQYQQQAANLRTLLTQLTGSAAPTPSLLSGAGTAQNALNAAGAQLGGVVQPL